jgi:hypothetical protein
MEKKETRLLEEWKANLDLLKFYETLTNPNCSRLCLRRACRSSLARRLRIA